MSRTPAVCKKMHVPNHVGTFMKGYMVTVIILVSLVAVLSVFLLPERIEFTFLESINNSPYYHECPQVVLIHDTEDYLYDKLNLSEYNIDLENNSILIIKDGILKNVKQIKKHFSFPMYTNFIKINIDGSKGEDGIFVYAIHKNDVYFDERYNEKDYFY